MSGDGFDYAAARRTGRTWTPPPTQPEPAHVPPGAHALALACWLGWGWVVWQAVIAGPLGF